MREITIDGVDFKVRWREILTLGFNLMSMY